MAERKRRLSRQRSPDETKRAIKEQNEMEFIIEHWRWIALGAAILGVLGLFVFGVSSAIPSSDALKEWSIQEAIFYGCLVIAFAIFVKA